MTALEQVLEGLGLHQYYDSLVAEGFDTWETILDIQESDLESLNVKLGHRRRLQRAIAEYRGIASDQPLGSPPSEAVNQEISKKEPHAHQQGSGKGSSSTTTEQKRRYRRHPKTDENAPERPPSAYVIFSSKIREEVKDENLSFTEIARLVGEKWQKLNPVEKEKYETHATSLKEDYSAQLAEYKKTPEYKQYQEYYADFKAKHGGMTTTDSKRPKLESSDSPVLSTMSPEESSEIMTQVSGHGRSGSIGSANTTPFGGLPSTPLTSFTHLSTSTSNMSALAGRRGSPHHRTDQDPRTQARLLSRSSVTDDNSMTKKDIIDSDVHITRRSFGTPPIGSPTPSASASRLARQEHYGSEAQFSQWPIRSSQSGSHRSPLSVTPSTSSTNTFSPLPTSSIPQPEVWRDRSAEGSRHLSSPTLTQTSTPTSSVPISQLVNPTTQAEMRTERSVRSPPEPSVSPQTTSQSFNTFIPAHSLAPPQQRQPAYGAIAYRQGHTTTEEEEEEEEGEEGEMEGTAARESDETPHFESTKPARRSVGKR